MRWLTLALVALLALPCWGQTGSRDFEESGTDNVNLGSPSWFTGPTALSVSLWYKPESTTPNATYIFFSAEDCTASDTGWVYFECTDSAGGDICAYTVRKEGVARCQLISSTSHSSINGSWTHFVGTWAGGATCDLYMNGIQDVGSSTKEAVDLSSLVSEYTYIGARDGTCNAGAELPADGLIAHVAVWDRSLSAGEAETLYSCTPNSISSGLVGYWPMTDPTTQFDISTNSYNGTNDGTVASTDGPPIHQCGTGGK